MQRALFDADLVKGREVVAATRGAVLMANGAEGAVSA
jgi:hypothetical protein